MRDFIIRFDSNENQFYCVVSDEQVIWSDSYEQCEKEVEQYADQNGIDMYRLKRVDR